MFAVQPHRAWKSKVDGEAPGGRKGMGTFIQFHNRQMHQNTFGGLVARFRRNSLGRLNNTSDLFVATVGGKEEDTPDTLL